MSVPAFRLQLCHSVLAAATVHMAHRASRLSGPSQHKFVSHSLKAAVLNHVLVGHSHLEGLLKHGLLGSSPRGFNSQGEAQEFAILTIPRCCCSWAWDHRLRPPGLKQWRSDLNRLGHHLEISLKCTFSSIRSEMDLESLHFQQASECSPVLSVRL